MHESLDAKFNRRTYFSYVQYILRQYEFHHQPVVKKKYCRNMPCAARGKKQCKFQIKLLGAFTHLFQLLCSLYPKKDYIKNFLLLS